MVYYVTHPNLEASAKVDAPSTEKARTTFLDFLERQGYINRADRQYWRRNMVAERLESPEDAMADIELSYGYEELHPRRTQEALLEGEVPYRSQAEILEHRYPEEKAGYGESEEAYREEEEPQQLTRTDIGEVAKEDSKSQKMSPIAQAALRGYK